MELKGYWKREGAYHSLDGNRRRRHCRRPPVRIAQLGASGGGGARRGFWRIRIPARIRFFRKVVASPRGILKRIRDAYVRVMVGFAGGTIGVGGAAATPAFGKSAAKEYDQKAIVQIYHAVAAQGRSGSLGSFSLPPI